MNKEVIVTMSLIIVLPFNVAALNLSKYNLLCFLPIQNDKGNLEHTARA